jgi:hypothetical protein
MQVEKKGVIYFEDYCKLMLRKYREEDEQEFIRIMFKVTRADHVHVSKNHGKPNCQNIVLALLKKEGKFIKDRICHLCMRKKVLIY